jgi:6-phosphogluconolactonase (cycloisomerase 2 family)
MKSYHLKKLLLLIICCISLSMTADAQRFVYTNNDVFGLNQNTVTGFNISQNGGLTILPDMPQKTGDGGGNPLKFDSVRKTVISDKGPFLFASNDGGGTISVFRIGLFDGSLTEVEGSPFNSHDANDDFGLSLALSVDEQYLYAGNFGDKTVSIFEIAEDGKLSLVPGTPYGVDGSPHQLTVSPDGKYLTMLLSNLNEFDSYETRIAVYTINGISLTPVPGSPFDTENTHLLDIVINCQSNVLYASVSKVFEPVVIEAFHIENNGSLTPLKGSPFIFDLDDDPSAGHLALSPNGKFLFTSGSSEITVLNIAPDGSLSPTPESPYGSLGVAHLETNREGTLLFAARLNQIVTVMKIEPDGKLIEIEGSPFSTGEKDGPQVDEGFLSSLAVYPPQSKCRILPPDNLTVSAANDSCEATVNYPAPQLCGYQCGQVEIVCKPESGSTFPIGVTTVTCFSNIGLAPTFTVTVKDENKPTLNCPANIAKSTDPNLCSAVVNFNITAQDNCGSVQVVANPPSGSVFAKGETIVQVTATDEAGNQSQCSFKVTVTDQQAPTLTCSADIVKNNEPGKCGATVNYQLPSVSDNCLGIDLGCNPQSGSIFPVGTTTVTCTAKDSSQNEGYCTFKVTVNDTEAPSITCPADVTAVAAKPCDAGVTVNYPAPTVIDNCPNLTVACVPASGAVFPVGTTTVNCTVTDGGGNQAQCSFKVTVFDVRLQDDANPNQVILFNSFTGAYRLCSPNLPQTVTGTGTVTKKACLTTLEHNTPERRLLAKVDPGTNKGNASYQSPPGSLKCTIVDKNIANNTNLCQ